jgi:DNA-binding Xre family transcriptional regulator
MVKLQIEKILHEKKITKTAFADMLGIKKQNV